MNQRIKTIIWENKMTGQNTVEIRKQISVHVWQSETDGRYYTIGILGWIDITDKIHLYDIAG